MARIAAAGRRQIDIQQPRRCHRPLDVLTDLNEAPALAMAHGAVGCTAHQMQCLHHRLQKFQQPSPATCDRCIAPHIEIQPIDALPHLGADLFAHLPRVVACGGDAAVDRGIALTGKNQLAQGFVVEARLPVRLSQPQRFEHAPPVTT
jgi:hypothetical protein